MKIIIGLNPVYGGYCLQDITHAFKYAGIKVRKYISLQASMEVWNYGNMQVCTYTTIYRYRYEILQICRFASKQAFKYSSMQISENKSNV